MSRRLAVSLGLFLCLLFCQGASRSQQGDAGKSPPDAKDLLKRIAELDVKLREKNDEAIQAKEASDKAIKKLDRDLRLLEATVKENASLPATGKPAPPQPSGTLIQGREDLGDLRKRISDLKLRLDTIDAELFGEEKDVVPPKKTDADLRRVKMLEAERDKVVAALAAARQALPKQTTRQKNAWILNELNQPIRTSKLQDVAAKHALEYIGSDPRDIPIVIDREAFIGLLGAEHPEPYEERVSFPPFPDQMPTSAALRLLLSQIAKGQATFLVRQGHVEIVVRERATAAFLLTQTSLFMTFDKRPLSEVVQDFIDESGLAINIDPNVGAKANMAISATFRNTSLENALVTITEMADLKFVVLERSVFVTTPDRVERLRKEERDRSKLRREFERKRLEPAM